MSKRKEQNREPKKAFQVVNMTNLIQLTDDENEFALQIQQNMRDSESLKNKSNVRIARRTYANSVMRRNNELTETAMIDIAIAAFHDHVVLNDVCCTLQQIIKLLAYEFKVQVTRTRFIDHIRKNAFHKKHTFLNDHDVIRFKLDM